MARHPDRKQWPLGAWFALPALAVAGLVLGPSPAARAQAAQPQDGPQVSTLIQQLGSPKEPIRLAAIALLGEVNLKIRDRVLTQPPEQLLRQLREAGPALARLTNPKEESSRAVRRAALTALGLVRAEGKISAEAWLRTLQNGDAAERQSVAQGILGYVVRNNELQNIPPQDKALFLAEFVSDVTAILPVMKKALQDTDPGVVTDTLNSLVGYLSQRNDLPEIQGEVAAGDPNFPKLQQALPLLGTGLADQVIPALVAVLRRGNRDHQVLAAQSLENLARLRDDRPDTSGNVKDPAKAPKRGRLVKADLAPAGLEAAAILNTKFTAEMPALAAALQQTPTETQVALLNAVEFLGALAKPLAPTLVGLLRHESRFVRWACARVLGGIGTLGSAAQDAPTVAGLAGLILEDDLDVSMAATQALAQLAPTARQAVPVLAQGLARDDSELKVTILDNLKRFTPAEAAPALPAVRQALANRESRVRLHAVGLLEYLGPQAQDALPDLSSLLSDTSPDVRYQAGLAMMKIAGR